ncbi:hypothetical protein Btru_062371 [Bulinus truncatus]|nr:hypothetical protein Btru_062371 [Bulinus truncatus]
MACKCQATQKCFADTALCLIITWANGNLIGLLWPCSPHLQAGHEPVGRLCLSKSMAPKQTQTPEPQLAATIRDDFPMNSRSVTLSEHELDVTSEISSISRSPLRPNLKEIIIKTDPKDDDNKQNLLCKSYV